MINVTRCLLRPRNEFSHRRLCGLQPQLLIFPFRQEHISQCSCSTGGRSPSLQGDASCIHGADKSSEFCLCLFCPRVCVPLARQNNAGGIPSLCSSSGSAVGPESREHGENMTPCCLLTFRINLLRLYSVLKMMEAGW